VSSPLCWIYSSVTRTSRLRLGPSLHSRHSQVHLCLKPQKIETDDAYHSEHGNQDPRGDLLFCVIVGPYCDGFTRALLPNRVRLQKIDSISASCLRMARGISTTGERLEFMCPPRFRRALPHLPDRILEPIEHCGSIPRKWDYPST
jgi:hypothetical protein